MTNNESAYWEGWISRTHNEILSRQHKIKRLMKYQRSLSGFWAVFKLWREIDEIQITHMKVNIIKVFKVLNKVWNEEKGR